MAIDLKSSATAWIAQAMFSLPIRRVSVGAGIVLASNLSFCLSSHHDHARGPTSVQGAGRTPALSHIADSRSTSHHVNNVPNPKRVTSRPHCRRLHHGAPGIPFARENL